MYLQGVSVLEAVGDQLSFGQVVEPGELAAAVSAGVEGCEPLVAPLQLREDSRSERWTTRGGVWKMDVVWVRGCRGGCLWEQG